MFYTGKGDKGICELGEGKRIPKTDAAIVAVGALDELNSLLGLVRNQRVSAQAKKELLDAQEKLFIIQAQIAVIMMGTQPASPSQGGYNAPPLPKNVVHNLEIIVDALEKKVKLGKHFIIPGACESAAWLDYARTLARRSELELLVFNAKSKKKIDPLALAYINRLSSLLYALARAEVHRNRHAGKKETRPSYT